MWPPDLIGRKQKPHEKTHDRNCFIGRGGSICQPSHPPQQFAEHGQADRALDDSGRLSRPRLSARLPRGSAQPGSQLVQGWEHQIPRRVVILGARRGTLTISAYPTSALGGLAPGRGAGGGPASA